MAVKVEENAGDILLLLSLSCTILVVWMVFALPTIFFISLEVILFDKDNYLNIIIHSV